MSGMKKELKDALVAYRMARNAALDELRAASAEAYPLGSRITWRRSGRTYSGIVQSRNHFEHQHTLHVINEKTNKLVHVRVESIVDEETP